MPKCELCGLYFRIITYSHLKFVHGISTYEYSDMFPSRPMRDEDFIKDEEDRRKAVSNSWWSRTPEEREEICQAMSKAQRGKVLSEDTRKRVSEASSRIQSDPEYQERHSRIMSPILREMWTRPDYRKLKTKQSTENSIRLWKDPNFRRKVLKGHRTEPTPDEIFMTEILEKNFPNQWEYTGTKPFKGGGKRRPDWTHKSLRKVLECDSLFWHSGYFGAEPPEVRIKHYAGLGYDCLILNEMEVVDSPILSNKIKVFTEKEELP